MNGRTLTRIVIAAAAIGIGTGLLLQLVLSFPASGNIIIPAAVILAALAAASQWDWVKDEVGATKTTSDRDGTTPSLHDDGE